MHHETIIKLNRLKYPCPRLATVHLVWDGMGWDGMVHVCKLQASAYMEHVGLGGVKVRLVREMIDWGPYYAFEYILINLFKGESRSSIHAILRRRSLGVLGNLSLHPWCLGGTLIVLNRVRYVHVVPELATWAVCPDARVPY